MKECCDMKGFLSFLVLKLISNRNMSGDEIREELKVRKGTMPSPGTIYPVLKSLSQSGFIQEIKGKGKTKKYRITKKGEKEIKIATRKFCAIFYDMKDDFRNCGC
ncbi:PadR family transcriptional regulator [Candidatus Woesearchaeota archaeon]|nr:PadR family transcriptional regulator [Candidatus Woesearchaeota archaeon]